MAETGSGVGRWIAGIAGTVIAGVLLALIVGSINDDDNGSTNGSGSDNITPISVNPDENGTPPLPDVLVGDWTQSSWDETVREGVTIGMLPFGGRMSVTDDGSSTWSVSIEDVFQDPPPNTPGADCRGRVSLAGEMVDTSLTGTRDYTGNMESARDDIAAAFCGEDGNGFTLSWAPDDAPQTMEMRNEYGVFVWQR